MTDNIQRGLEYAAASDFLAGRASRREFLRRLAIAGGGTMLGLTLVGSLACETSTPAPTITAATTPAATTPATTTAEPGVTVSPDDPRIEAGPVEFQSGGNNLLGYISRPKGPGPHPAILVIHENRGLLPHFPDVTRRLALEGYVALAIDLLSTEGGTGSFADSNASRDALGGIPEERLVEDMNGAVSYLQGLDHVRPDRVGAMGFCFGGSMVWLLAVRNPEIRAAAPFYGSSPPLNEVPNLRAAVLGNYAEDDDRINQGVPDLEAALQQNQKEHRFVTYPGTRHAFFNDTGGRYNPQAAGAAWTETLAWMERHLMG